MAREQRRNIQPAVTQEVTQAERLRRNPSKRLTELGGMALVEFHLARRGAEFTRTQALSPKGDIWADCAGKMLAIEVKTTFDMQAWQVKRGQNGADIYCLVNLEEAICYVLYAAEMLTLLSGAKDMFPGLALVQRSSLPADCCEAWTRLGLRRLPGVAPRPRPQRVYTNERRVKRVLATGETKVYVYPPTAAP